MSPEAPPTPADTDPQDPGRKRRNPWIWVSAVLAVVAAGLLIWALTTQSDLDKAQETGTDVVEQGREAYNDLSQDLGATSGDLEATEEDLAAAQQKADQAEQDAAASEREQAQAKNDAEKAQAETDKAQAAADAADSKAAIAADCAKAYLSSLGMLFEGESVKAQAEAVKQELNGISATCKSAFEGT